MPASAGYVRAVLRDDLAVLPEPVREEVALIATELLGNAVLHARALDDGQLAIAWGVGEHGVEISVTDGGSPTQPLVAETDSTERGVVGSRSSRRWPLDGASSSTIR